MLQMSDKYIKFKNKKYKLYSKILTEKQFQEQLNELYVILGYFINKNMINRNKFFKRLCDLNLLDCIDITSGNFIKLNELIDTGYNNLNNDLGLEIQYMCNQIKLHIHPEVLEILEGRFIKILLSDNTNKTLTYAYYDNVPDLYLLYHLNLASTIMWSSKPS
jgi:hypothetical protein